MSLSEVAALVKAGVLAVKASNDNFGDPANGHVKQSKSPTTPQVFALAPNTANEAIFPIYRTVTRLGAIAGLRTHRRD